MMFLRTALAAAAVLANAAPGPSMSTAQTSAPSAMLSNGQIRARVYLPDPVNGFYRSTRFDWSGLVGSLEYAGHDFYGPWFTGRDPSVRDFVYRNGGIVVSDQSAAVGPAEEFRTPLGYAEAAAGGTFVKIGVGVLRKPDDSRYSGYARYPVVDSGRWTVASTDTSVEASQDVNDPASGYGYAYRKVIRLVPGRAEMRIEHRLRNTGRRSIQTRQYNHNFLVLDQATTGPDFVITLPFEIRTTNSFNPQLAAVEGNRIVYRRRLEGQESVAFGIEGFSADPKDYDVRVENRTLGAGVRITSDRGAAAMSLWSIRSNISFEPDVDINLAPGETTDWTFIYTYFMIGK